MFKSIIKGMRRMRYKNLHKKEEGSVIIIFALSLFALVFFVGLAIDFGIIYFKRNDLVNLCQLMRKDRFTYQDSIRYSDNPGAEVYKIASDAMHNNGFDGDLKVYFYEEEPPALANERHYKTRIKLSIEVDYHFLRLFGEDKVTVSASIDGSENFGEGGNDVIWHPAVPPASYSGSYSGKPGAPYTSFIKGDKPSGW